MSQAAAGAPWTLFLDFYDETTGALVDPSSVQLDITYGQQVGLGPDVAGPYVYEGASSAVPGKVWRTGVGQYAAVWDIPAGTPQGVYVANWTCQYGGYPFLGVENFSLAGGFVPTVPAGDVGFWTGGISNTTAGIDIEFGQVDEDGICWLWQKIEGWDGPDVQGAGVIARAGDHGAWASPQYYAARTLTLTVTASAPTQALRDLARAKLQQAIPISDLAVLRYDEPIPKFARIRRSGKVTEAPPSLADVTFTCGLVAPDPRKYGTVSRDLTIGLLSATAGGSLRVPFTAPFSLAAAPPPGVAVANNAGSFDTAPIALITGPVTSPSLSNVRSGRTVTWTGLTLGAGDVMAVDFLNRQAFINPSTVSTDVGIPSVGGTYWPADVTSAWWQLLPGDNQIGYGGIAGTGTTAQYFWRDAWV